jgi:Uma2 family endonuclease
MKGIPAMVETKARPMTVEELWELRHDPYRFALIEGELYRMPGAGGTHGLVTTNCAGYLVAFAKPRRLGGVFTETGFRLSPDQETTLFPDVAFVRAPRMPPPDRLDRFLQLVPDLAVEIVSPTDYPTLVDTKLAVYAAAGTPEVWVLRPKEQTVQIVRHGRTVATLGSEETLDGGDLLPGFSIKVADLFG